MSPKMLNTIIARASKIFLMFVILLPSVMLYLSIYYIKKQLFYSFKSKIIFNLTRM